MDARPAIVQEGLPVAVFELLCELSVVQILESKSEGLRSEEVSIRTAVQAYIPEARPAKKAHSIRLGHEKRHQGARLWAWESLSCSRHHRHQARNKSVTRYRGLAGGEARNRADLRLCDLYAALLSFAIALLSAMR